MKPDCRGPAGFTLLELLATIVVLGFVVVLLSQGFRFGVQAARLTSVEHEMDMLAVDQAVRHLVQAADPGIYPEPAALRGTADTLTLSTELPSGGDGPPQRVDAVLSANEGRLVLHWRLHRHVEPFGPGAMWQETVLSEGIEGVALAFLAPSSASGWVPDWSSDRLPALVRLTLTLRGPGPKRWPPIVVAPRREAVEE